MQSAVIDSAQKVNISQLKLPEVLHAVSSEDQSEKISGKSKQSRINRRTRGKDSIFVAETAAANLPRFTEEDLLVDIPDIEYVDHNGNRRAAGESPWGKATAKKEKPKGA